MNPIRPITKKEQDVVEHLLHHLKLPGRQFKVPTQVWTMNDGGMGTISFDVIGEGKFGKDLIQGEYTDRDGTLVIITLTADQMGELFELEFWKTDFVKLLEYPAPGQIKILPPATHSACKYTITHQQLHLQLNTAYTC